MKENYSADALARTFGADTETARDVVSALYESLCRADDAAIDADLAHWKELTDAAGGLDLVGRPQAIDALAKAYRVAVDQQRPEALLFALHTYYALLVKLLPALVMAAGRDVPKAIEQLTQAGPGEPFRRELQRLLSNDTFGDLQVVDLWAKDPFSWYLRIWSDTMERAVRQVVERLAGFDPNPTCGDLLKPLYMSLFPRAVRHRLGEYYTPDWLVEHVLDAARYEGDRCTRVLDPTCGSGTFLMAAIRRILDRRPPSVAREELGRAILAGVVGFDLNPLAVMAAKANYLMALRDVLPKSGRIEIPIHLRDAILDGPISAETGPESFDYVVGNPPWIAWDNLPDAYRQATKPLWQQYGLFSLSGTAARHGGAKKDLSMLVLYVAADRYLKPSGRLAMVMTQTLFQTRGAGDGFRRFRLGPDGDWLHVLQVDDMVAIRPFEGTSNWTSTLVLEKGSPTRFPVPYVVWSPGDDDPSRFTRQTLRAEPIQPDRPGSPWFVRPSGFDVPLTQLVGPSDYTAHLGANTGGANGIYWLKLVETTDTGLRVENLAGKSRRPIETVQASLEPDLLFPLVRWSDVSRYRATASAHLLLAQDPSTRTGIDETLMQQEYPQAYAYLQHFEDALRARAAYRQYQDDKPFYSMYNIGPYTMAPVKVVWRRMDRRINAAVVEEVTDPHLGRRTVIPQETCVLIACDSSDEAHYLCAVLNSAIVGFLVTAHSVRGGKGFGSPGILDYLRLKQFEPNDPRHQQLAAASRRAHRAVDSDDALGKIQREIDRLAGRLWGLNKGDLAAIVE